MATWNGTMLILVILLLMFQCSKHFQDFGDYKRSSERDYGERLMWERKPGAVAALNVILRGKWRMLAPQRRRQRGWWF